MNMLEKIGLKALHKVDPETAHGLAIKALQMGLVPKTPPITSKVLKCEIAGIALDNPLGLAAGFDKNAQTLHALINCGLGFIEVGAATPKPQAGNPKPRLFRLSQDQAAINRFGFNNQGMDAIAHRLENRPKSGVIGINLGANKDSDNRASDFAKVLSRCGPYVDFATVNVSSPNTEKLRDLQGKAALSALFDGVFEARDKLKKPVPVFLKIAPDLEQQDLFDIAQVAKEKKIDAIIATNTTLSREGLNSPEKSQTGGLSGAPLFEKSTKVLANLYKITEGEIPIIGVGGISTGLDAYQKIRAGASALQLYTALVYGGMSLIKQILHDLENTLHENGFETLDQAIGSGVNDWL